MELNVESDIFVSFEFTGKDAEDTEKCDKMVENSTQCMKECGYHLSNYSQVTLQEMGSQVYIVEHTWTKGL